MPKNFSVTPTIDEDFKLKDVKVSDGDYGGTIYIDPDNLDNVVNKLIRIRDRYKAVSRALESLEDSSMVF